MKDFPVNKWRFICLTTLMVISSAPTVNSKAFGYQVMATDFSEKTNLSDESDFNDTLLPVDEFCKLKCQVNNDSSNFCTCQSDNNNKKLNLTYSKDNTTRLICRGETQLIFTWTPLNLESTFYRLENSDGFAFYGLANDSTVTFEDLQPNRWYRLSVWNVNDRVNEIIVGQTSWVKTLSKNYDPMPVEKLEIGALDLVSTFSLQTEITWMPSKTDIGCFYEIVWWDTMDYGQKEIRQPNGSTFRTTISNLQLNTNYSLGIMSKSQNWQRESEKIWINFITPSCLDIHRNLTICAPEQPENVTVAIRFSTDSTKTMPKYDVTVTWKKPQYQPDEYLVKLLTLSDFHSRLSDFHVTANDLDSNESAQIEPESFPILKRVDGNATTVIYRGVSLKNFCQILISAVSSAGESEPAVLHQDLPHVMTMGPFMQESVWNPRTVSATIFITLFLLLIFYILRQCVHRHQNKDELHRYFKGLNVKLNHTKNPHVNENASISSVPTFDYEYCKFEIANDRLVLLNVLGEGCFGQVRKAKLMPENIDVAVKKLKATATIDDVEEFKREIEIMRSVGAHPHIVSIIGHCTGNCAPLNLMLVVEFCAFGDLQRFLHRSWSYLLMCSASGADFVNLNNINTTINEMYEYQANKQNGVDYTLTPLDLLSFARQIAIGMEYLSSNRVVHRDLAARNVLITSERTLKISDFGLSRDIYQQNVYRKNGGGKLPIKWMALESITHQLYTTKSDVWSFGVLLWEIVTLGGNPYPNVTTQKLIHILRSGYRMECPSNCSNEVYEIMSACWKARPCDRPDFRSVRESIEKLIEGNAGQAYLNLDLNLENHKYSNIDYEQMDPEEANDLRRCSSLINLKSDNCAYGNMTYEKRGSLNLTYESFLN